MSQFDRSIGRSASSVVISKGPQATIMQAVPVPASNNGRLGRLERLGYGHPLAARTLARTDMASERVWQFRRSLYLVAAVLAPALLFPKVRREGRFHPLRPALMPALRATISSGGAA